MGLRIWQNAFEGSLKRLQDTLIESECSIVHIQFNFGFFNLEQLGQLLDNLSESKKVVVTFHKTKDSYVGKRKVSLKAIVASLNKCWALMVHQKEDIEVLEGFGVRPEKIVLIPHGQVTYQNVPKLEVRKNLA